MVQHYQQDIVQLERSVEAHKAAETAAELRAVDAEKEVSCIATAVPVCLKWWNACR
jgi:hypothetical protein